MTLDSRIKPLISRPTFLRSAATLSGALIALGCASPVIAQTQSQSPKEDMARCSQLYGTYSKYSGRQNYSHAVDVDTALEDCRKGNFAAGIAGLSAALQRAGIPIPPVETASNAR